MSFETSDRTNSVRAHGFGVVETLLEQRTWLVRATLQSVRNNHVARTRNLKNSNSGGWVQRYQAAFHRFRRPLSRTLQYTEPVQIDRIRVDIMDGVHSILADTCARVEDCHLQSLPVPDVNPGAGPFTEQEALEFGTKEIKSGTF